MYICLDCGHHFNPGEEVTLKDYHGDRTRKPETFTGCPVCRGAFEPSKSCSSCGSDVLEDELYPGDLCRECLEAKVTLSETVKYVADYGLEVDFYLSHWTESKLGRDSSPSQKLIEIAQGAWMAFAERSPEEALSVCKKFILDDGLGMYDYAEWLEGANHEK